MTDASQADRKYMDQIQARIKQQAAQRAAKEAGLGSANEPAQAGSSASALVKRAWDARDSPGWVNTQDQYNDLGREMTKLKSDHGEKELEWQRQLSALRESHEESMID